MKKILVVNVNWLGDVILSTPVFKALKKFYPQARLSCLGVPRIREILESSPSVDEVIIYDEKGKDWHPLAKLKLILGLRRRRFDAVFILHRSMTRALLMFLAGIPRRIGYDVKAKRPLLTHLVKVPAQTLHRSDYYLRTIETFGVPVEDRVCEIEVSAEAKEEVERLLLAQGVQRNEEIVVVNTGGNWDLKRWPKENFAKLIQRLVKDFHIKVVIPGGEQDLEQTREITRLSGVATVILAGQTTFKQLAALMHRACLVITADTGPLHVAASVGTDTIALFGPTRPEVTGPRGKGRSIVLHHDVGCNREPCYYLECPENTCMQSITVKEVLGAVKKFRESKERCAHNVF